jgi:hypothetical protein
MSTEVLQEMAQKDRHIWGLNILPLKLEVKRQVSSPGRDSKGRDGRDSFSPVEMTQDGSLSPRCPCSANIGNEQKSTLIEEGQMGSKCDGFFLLPANVPSSNVLSLPRPFPEPDVLAFGNSIPTPSEVAKGGWGDNEFQKICELLRPHGAWSKDRCCSQKLQGLSAKASPIAFSLVLKVWQDDPERLSDSSLFPLPSERPVAIEKRNLRRILVVEPPPTRSCPFLATGLLVGAASPVALGSLKVSWPLL